MKDTLIILGSSRNDGNTREIAERIKDKSDADFLNLSDYSINYYEYDDTNREDDFIKVIEILLNYKQIVFATPVYWYSMSAQLKTFFDRITDLITIRKDLGRQLLNKNVYLVSCSASEIEPVAFDIPFKETSAYLKMNFIAHLHVWKRNEDFSVELSPKIDKFVKLILEKNKNL